MRIITKAPTRIVSVLKKSSLFAILLTATSIAILTSYIEYLDFSKRAKDIESEHISSEKALIKREVIKVTDYIKLKRSQIEQKVKARIKSRVYDAHAVASNIYNQFTDKRPDSEVKKLIIEALRPLRFFNGDGYYFINDMKGVSQLNTLHSDLEGSDITAMQDSTGRYIVKEQQDVVNKFGEGFVSYNYLSFNNVETPQKKISFVKYFEPYGWFIGTGDYYKHIEKEIQQEMLDYIEQIKFGKDSYIFVVSYEGIVLMNASQKHLIGQNIWDLEDPNGVKVIQEERRAVDNPEGDFIYYVWNKPSTSTPSPKVSFMKGVPDWQWMIGAGIYVDDAEIIIHQQREDLKKGLIKQWLFIFLISLFSSLLIIYVANKISRQFSIELSKFLAFFKTMSIESDKISEDSLHYIELRELANSANRMLDNQIKIEEERAKTEESLRASEASMKEAQKITHFGSWEYNIATNELLWSDEVYRIFEVDSKNTKASYQLFINNVHPDDQVLVDTTYKESVANKLPYDVEHRIKLKNDKIKIVREYGRTFFDEKGNPLRTFGTIQDITERKLQEDKLKLKEEQLKRSQKMDALGKLTGGIAHDYNNMLGVISGFSELLSVKVADDPKAAIYIKHIRDAAERGRELTDKLMTFSRYKLTESEVTNINLVLKAQRPLLEKTLTARIKLTLSLVDDIWPIKLDSGDLADSIINMGINTSHAIEASGNLTLTTQNVHINDSKASQLDLKAGDYVTLSINDTGKGMDRQTVDQIFDPFFSTKGDKGTGLGLSQVFGFVQRSGGDIKVVSKPGHGTEFTLYFPRYYTELDTIQKESPDSHKEVQSNHSYTEDNEVILVVDDEPALCAMARDILTNSGYRVLTAEDGKHALEILKNEPVDLMISDVIMPNMDGYQLATIVERDYPNTIIQLVSGFDDVPNQVSINNKLQKNILQKPYSVEALLARVKVLFDKSNLASNIKY